MCEGFNITCRLYTSYIDAGKLLELDSYLSESLDGMKEGVIETASSGGKIYGMPLTCILNGTP